MPEPTVPTPFTAGAMARPAVVELVYFNAGGGHRASALALEAAIDRAGLPWTVRLTHLFEVLDPTARFRQWTGMEPEDLYNRRLARGWTLGLAQELRVLQGMIRWSHRTLVRRLAAHWQQAAPDLVVSLVPNFNRALGESVAAALPGVPFVTVMTDLADCPPHFWIEPERAGQHIVCGSPRAVAQARAAGCGPGRIHATSGMVLSPAFHDLPPLDRPAERAALGFAGEEPVGLVLFGGEGSRAMLGIARQLADTPLILACGRNAALAGALRALPARAPRLVLDYTRELPRYMRLADFFIGKPGSGSLSEAVQMGLPPIVTRNRWTMPQERYGAEWVQAGGLGLVLPRFAELSRAVQALQGELPRFRAAVRRQHNRAAFEVPQVLAGILAQARAAGAPASWLRAA